MSEAQYDADEFVSFDLPSTLVSTSETPTGRLRFVHNPSHVGQAYRLQQRWLVIEHRHDKVTGDQQEFRSDVWRDVPCVEEGEE